MNPSFPTQPVPAGLVLALFGWRQAGVLDTSIALDAVYIQPRR